MNDKHNKTIESLNSISSTFCLAKWYRTNLRLYNGTSYSCHHCVPRKIDKDKLQSDVSQLTNTKEVLEFREQMVKGIRPSECSYCWNKEDKNLISDRIIKSSIFLENESVNVEITAKELNSTPIMLDIAFNNTCNFACAYCGPANSSKWMEEIEKYGEYPTVYKKKTLNSVKKEITLNREKNEYIDAFWEWWDNGLKQNLRKLTITGGEPLLSKHTNKLIDCVIKDDLPKLELNINTNLYVPEKIFNLFYEKIKNNPKQNISITTSIESTGKRAEYARYGLNYNKWLENFHKIITKSKNVHVNLTNNALSFTDMYNVLNMLLDIKLLYPNVWISSNDVSYPTYLDLRILPQELREENTKKIRELINLKGSILSDVEKEKILRTIDYSLTEIPNKETNVKDFKIFIQEYDKRKNLNFSEVFPELKDFFNSII